MAIPAAYPAFVRIGGCGADRPAQCVGAAFSDVACTSAYDMAAALKVVEECQSFVSAEFVAYVKRAMHLYRLKIKAGTIELKDEHYAFYHNFRVAKSWAEVVTAFNGVTSPAAVNSGHRGGDHRRMMDMMMEIFPPSNEEERAVRDAARKILRQEREAKEKRQRANASDAQLMRAQADVLDHVEEIISAIVSELNHEDMYHQMHAQQKLEGSIQARHAIDFTGHAIEFFSSGFPRNAIKGVFDSVLNGHEEATAPLAPLPSTP